VTYKQVVFAERTWAHTQGQSLTLQAPHVFLHRKMNPRGRPHAHDLPLVRYLDRRTTRRYLQGKILLAQITCSPRLGRASTQRDPDQPAWENHKWAHSGQGKASPGTVKREEMHFYTLEDIIKAGATWGPPSEALPSPNSKTPKRGGSGVTHISLAVLPTHSYDAPSLLLFVTMLYLTT
jgi:hypothetical protein